MTRRATSAVVSVTVLLSAFACGGSDTGPSPALNLTGTWNGSVVFQGGPVTARWDATQSGTNVSGPLTVTGQNATAAGTMTGTLSGSQLTANISVPAGAFPGVPTCSMTASGPLTASASALSGTINSSWTAACVGTISAFATQTGQVTLSK